MIHQHLSRRSLLAGLALSLALAAAPALADGHGNLRASGAAGERFDGFLELRDPSAAGAKAKVAAVNKKRRKIYAKRAKSDNVKVEQVGQIYAQEIMEKAPKGTWFLKKNGKWVQK